MILSDQSPITFADPLPDAVDVVVVGAGVIGTSTALFLAERGVSVLLCEKGRVAGEQSSRNWGWIRQQGRDAAELPIVIDSINTWERLADRLPTNIGFERRGVAYLAETDEALAEFERWLDVAQTHQLDTRMLSSAEVDALIDHPAGQWKGALYTPSDGRAEPFKAVPALARLAQASGAVVREACAVRTVESTAGRTSGVVTEAGPVKASTVICAGGAWSTFFLANLGITLPQLAVRATVTRTAPAPDLYAGNASMAEVAIRRRQDGGYTVASSATNEHFIGADSFRYFFKFLPALRSATKFLKLRIDGEVTALRGTHRPWTADAVSPFELDRVLNPQPSQKALARMRLGLRRRLPALAELPFEEAWAGLIDVTPDVVPVMDQIPGHPGLFVATGFSGHGFGIGPGAGSVMADLVTGRPPAHDLTRFRFSRFSDGSPIRPGPGLQLAPQRPHRRAGSNHAHRHERAARFEPSAGQARQRRLRPVVPSWASFGVRICPRAGLGTRAA